MQNCFAHTELRLPCNVLNSKFTKKNLSAKDYHTESSRAQRFQGYNVLPCDSQHHTTSSLIILANFLVLKTKHTHV